MIHTGFSKTEIAYRYYAVSKPDKKYPREIARMRFDQDKHIDTALVKKIVKEIASEQIGMLKK